MKYKNLILMPIVVFVIMILSTSFVLNDLNFMNWSMNARFLVAMTTVFSIPFGILIHNS